MGETTINGPNISENVSQVKLRLPLNCDPGTIEVYKFGHKRLKITNINPGLDGDQSLGEFEMPTTKRMNLEVRIIGPTDSNTALGKGFTDYDKGFLIFTPIGDDELIQVIEIDKQSADDLTVDLTIGNYSVEGFLIYNEPFTIPGQEYCYPDGFMGSVFGDEECQDVPEINMESWVRGGIEVDNFEISEKNLLLKDTIIVSLIDIGVPESYEDIEKVGTVMSNLEGVSHPPRFK